MLKACWRSTALRATRPFTKCASACMHAGLLAEYVNAVRLALALDTIVRCRASGDYSLEPAAGRGPAMGATRAWRLYRCEKLHDLQGVLSLCYSSSTPVWIMEHVAALQRRPLAKLLDSVLSWPKRLRLWQRATAPAQQLVGLSAAGAVIQV